MSAWFWLIAWGLWCLVMAWARKLFARHVAHWPAGLAETCRSGDGHVHLMYWPFWFSGNLVRRNRALVALFDRKLITIDPANENYAVDSPGLRITLVSLLCMLGFWRFILSMTNSIAVFVQLGRSPLACRCWSFFRPCWPSMCFAAFSQLQRRLQYRPEHDPLRYYGDPGAPTPVFLIPREKLSLRLFSVLVASAICTVYVPRGWTARLPLLRLPSSSQLPASHA